VLSFRTVAGSDDLTDLEALYRDRYAVFLRAASAIVEDSDLARDVIQEAFAAAINRRRSLLHREATEAWLWRIVTRKAFDQLRRRQRTGTQPSGWVDASTVAEASQTPPENDPLLRAAIRSLPERQRLALFLRFYADLDYRAIAGVLGVAPGTVAASLNAAQKSLKVRSH
jgi:RNA polymerase sigma factor (sigma-70 family)